MPRSFLVRLKPSIVDTTANSKSFTHALSGDVQSSHDRQSDETSFKPTTTIAEQITPGKEISPETAKTNDNPSTLELGRKHHQSYPEIMRPSHGNSQSNPAAAMMSHYANQSQISTVKAYHHGGGQLLEMAVPPQYHIMPYEPSWYQYERLSSCNNTYCYPLRLSHVDGLRWRHPGELERVLYTGEVTFPRYCKEDILLARTAHGKGTIHHYPVHQVRDGGQQKVSNTTKLPATIAECFSVPMPGKEYRERELDKAGNYSAIRELQPRGQTDSSQHNQKVIEHTNETTAKERGHGLLTNDMAHHDTYERSISDQTDKEENNNIETTTMRPSPGESELHSELQIVKTEASSHTCEQCHKTFNRASNLRAHMKTHSDNKPFKCDYCGKGFHQKMDKRVHHYTHTGEKPHKCTKCGRGFKQLTHLNYHMRTHSDTHMYHCTYCNKGFNQKGNLQAHIYGHTGQRPFKCEICGKGFTLRSTLNTHLRTHAPKKPFVCEHCNKAFYQKNALKMHYIASHPIVNGKSML